jgi:flagellar basal-body rod modification protein FlgD
MISSVSNAGNVGTTGLDPTQGPAAAAAAEPTAAARNDTIDQEQFLMLFIEQLQNQDPLNPLDVNGMTEQLAQFSSLEQLYGINSNIKALSERLGSPEALDPLGFLGAEVTVPGDALTIADGEISSLVVDVPAEATAVEVAIVGPSGDPVRQVTLGPQAAGELDLATAGIDVSDLADGAYTVVATGVDAEGEPIELDTFVQETVTGIDLSAEPPVLLLGEREVSIADVRKIRSPENEA